MEVIPSPYTKSQTIKSVDMSVLAIIYQAPTYLMDLYIEAFIKGDMKELLDIIAQMRVEVAKGNLNPNPPKVLIDFFSTQTDVQFEVHSNDDGDVKIHITDNNFIPKEGEKTAGVILCGVNDIRAASTTVGKAVVAYETSEGEKRQIVPIDRVMSKKEIEMLREEEETSKKLKDKMYNMH